MVKLFHHVKVKKDDEEENASEELKHHVETEEKRLHSDETSTTI